MKIVIKMFAAFGIAVFLFICSKSIDILKPCQGISCGENNIFIIRN